MLLPHRMGPHLATAVLQRFGMALVLTMEMVYGQVDKVLLLEDTKGSLDQMVIYQSWLLLPLFVE